MAQEPKTPTRNSDYDLAFIKFDKLKTEDEYNSLTEIETFLKEYKVDIVNLSYNKSIVLHHNVFRFGKLIYEKKKKTCSKN